MDAITGFFGILVDFVVNPPVSVVRGATDFGVVLFNCTIDALTVFGGVVVNAVTEIF